MPQAPAALGNIMESALGRPAQVLDVHETAPGFVELELRAAAPPGGWCPGHEIQFRVTPTLGRRYTVRTVAEADEERVSLLVATDSGGPGATWARGLRPGTQMTVLAGRHRPLRENGALRLYLGDGSALGTFDACARRGGGTVVVIVEVPAEAVVALADRWPGYRFLAADGAPGDASQLWLERAVADGTLGASRAPCCWAMPGRSSASGGRSSTAGSWVVVPSPRSRTGPRAGGGSSEGRSWQSPAGARL